jgi:putative intracellular protease/amidase
MKSSQSSASFWPLPLLMPPHSASNGLHITDTVSFREFRPDGCCAILVPGGNPDSIFQNKDIDCLLKTANERNILIAAICAGPSLVAKAGILRGRRIAHGYEQEQIDFLKEIFTGVILTAKP